jgi:hypothetical protein
MGFCNGEKNSLAKAYIKQVALCSTHLLAPALCKSSPRSRRMTEETGTGQKK